MKRDFESQKDELMKQVRSVLNDVEALYNEGVDNGTEEAKALKAKLQDKLSNAKEQLLDFENNASKKVKEKASEASEKAKRKVRQADELVQEKPYYAMGFAALAGLVVGVLLNRR